MDLPEYMDEWIPWFVLEKHFNKCDSSYYKDPQYRQAVDAVMASKFPEKKWCFIEDFLWLVDGDEIKNPEFLYVFIIGKSRLPSVCIIDDKMVPIQCSLFTNDVPLRPDHIGVIYRVEGEKKKEKIQLDFFARLLEDSITIDS